MSERPPDGAVFRPDYAIPPGRTLRDTLAQLGMAQADFAVRAGLSAKHVNQIIQGVATITPDTALAIEKVTGVAARVWNRLESSYREQLARVEDKESLEVDRDWLSALPVTELKKRGYLTKGADEGTLMQEVCRFFGVANRHAWEAVWKQPLAAFRRSAAFASDSGAVATWLRIGELEAAEIECAPFDAKRFRDVLQEIRALTTEKPEVFLPKLRELCSSAGVAVVFVPEIPKCRTSGAARWLSPTKAMIVLSLRHKTNDHLWFSFFHEAGHLLLHSKKETFVSNGKNGLGDEEEEEANRFASATLIPKRFEPELWSLEAPTDIVEFAEMVGIAPGIVVGRLQREKQTCLDRGLPTRGLDWSDKANKLKVTFMFVDS